MLDDSSEIKESAIVLDNDSDDAINKSSDSVPLDLADFSCVVCG